MSELTHIDAEGEARMVDVSAKPEQDREAMARGEIRLAAATLDAIESGDMAKGNVLATCLLYTSPSPRDRTSCRMPSSA